MKNERKFFIDGKWVEPHSKQTLEVLNPANEEVIGTIALGDQTDVDRAVAAARKAFETFSQTSVKDRAALLEKVMGVYQKRMPEIAATVSKEMGAPISLANMAQAPAGLRAAVERTPAAGGPISADPASPAARVRDELRVPTLHGQCGRPIRGASKRWVPRRPRSRA